MTLWKKITQGNRSSFIVCCAIIAAATFAAFQPSLDNGFVNRDDPGYVTDNPDIREFTPHHLARIFSSTYVSHYLPVTMLNYMAEYSLFGLHPAGWHITSLLLHIANSILVFMLLFALSRSRTGAFAAALLFAVHPLRVEPVAWIAERKELLSAFFYLISLLSWLSYRQKGGRRRYAICLVALLASLLSKSMSVSQPFVLLLIDYLQGRKIGWKAVREKLPFFALSFLFMAVAIISAQHYITSYPGYSFVRRLLLPGWTVAFYIVKSLIPVRLCASYYLPVVPERGMDIAAAISTFALLGIAVAILRWGRRSRAVVFAALFFLVTLAPVIQVVNSGGQVLVADRYTYIPLLGLYYLCAVGLARLFSRESRAVKAAVAGAVGAAGVVLAVLTWQRCAVWKDSLTLWNDVIQKEPLAPLAYVGRGGALRDLGQYDPALADYDQAIRLDRTSVGAWFGRGYIHCLQGRVEQAIGDLQESLRLAPESADAWNQLGIALGKKDDCRGAIDDFSAAIQLKPDFAAAYVNRALSNIGCSGSYAAALDDLGRAIAIDPRFEKAYLVRGMVFMRKGDSRAAFDDFSKSIAVNPRSVDALFYRGMLCNNLGRSNLAIRDLNQAMALDPRNAGVYNQRGIARAMTGYYDGAIADFDKAIELDPRNTGAFMQNRQRAIQKMEQAGTAAK